MDDFNGVKVSFDILDGKIIFESDVVFNFISINNGNFNVVNFIVDKVIIIEGVQVMVEIESGFVIDDDIQKVYDWLNMVFFNLRVQVLEFGMNLLIVEYW